MIHWTKSYLDFYYAMQTWQIRQSIGLFQSIGWWKAHRRDGNFSLNGSVIKICKIRHIIWQEIYEKNLPSNWKNKTRQSKHCGFSIYIFDNSKSESMVRLVRAEKMVLSGLVFARKIARMILIENIQGLMGPRMINMAFMPLYMWEMWDVTPVTHERTNSGK